LYKYGHEQVKWRKKRWNNKEIFIENKYVNRKLNMYTINVFLFVSIGVFHFECSLFVYQFMMGLFDMYQLYGITCSCTG
jgi:hypothetical protein